MANIQQRRTKDGQVRYRAMVRLKGHPLQTSTHRRKTDALRWAQKVEADIRDGRFFRSAEAKRHTMGEAIDRYLTDVLPRKPRSEKQQTQQLGWWRTKIGNTLLSDVSPALIVKHRDALAKKTSPSNANRYFAILSHVFTVAMKEWQWVEDTPFRKLSRLKEPEGRVRYLSDPEREALLKACQENSNPHLYDAVVLALSTGCRKNEIVHLQWRDVDLDRQMFVLSNTKNGTTRSVPLTGHALERMKERSRIRKFHCDFVFPLEHKPKPADIDRDFARAREAAGIEDFRFHDLRHSCASYLAMGGASLPEIAAVLGHRTLAMTQRYAHISQPHTAAVVARMNAKLFGAESSKASQQEGD